jgi:mRNA interferase MazF
MSAGRIATPRRGEVWWLNFNPTLGHEQRGHRPALVLSVDKWNALQTGLIVVLPITGTRRKNLPRVDVDPPEGGLQKPSAIICEQVRTVSVERLGTRLGELSPKTLTSVELIVRQLLGL